MDHLRTMPVSRPSIARETRNATGKRSMTFRIARNPRAEGGGPSLASGPGLVKSAHRLSSRLALACGLLLLAAAASEAGCPSVLSGRVVAIDPATRGFGAVQQLPPLPLQPGEYALTIDDGPSPKTTQALLDILRSRCVSATFFLVGRNAAKHPDLVRRIAAEGDGVGSHSFSHGDFGKLPRNGVAEEIWNGVQAVEKAANGGIGQPKLFRFPGSRSFPPVVPPDLVALANGMGEIVAGYDFSPEDWRNSPPDESFRRLLSRLGDRGVILMHDGQSNTLKLLPMVLDELERRGARIVSLRVAD